MRESGTPTSRTFQSYFLDLRKLTMASVKARTAPEITPSITSSRWGQIPQRVLDARSQSLGRTVSIQHKDTLTAFNDTLFDSDCSSQTALTLRDCVRSRRLSELIGE